MKWALKHFLDKVDAVQFCIAFTIMGVFFMIANALVYREIPEGNREILIHMLGIVEGAVMTIVGFYYGSSKGSQKKDEVRKIEAEAALSEAS